MSDGASIRWTATGDTGQRPPVVMLHGGPGLPDYLGDLDQMIADLAPVYRYDQRGTGGSRWQGRHTLARHIEDLAALLDRWKAPKAVLIGHSYGTDLAARFCLAYPDRVAAMLLMCGPFVGDWRAGYRSARLRRMSAEQQERLQELQTLPSRTEEREVELLTLSWFTDHADLERGWDWAAQAARKRRPVNWEMNRELGAESHADPLERHVDALRACLPERVELLGGTEDPRPLSALASLGRRLGVPLTRVVGAGHEPWREQPDAVRAHLRRFVQAG
jgi:proline iminopeptidase